MKNLTVIEADALDAYIYGYPIVMMGATQRNMRAGGLENNRFLNESTFPGPKTNTVVRPNVDTLYTTAWLELSKEPVVLGLPDTGGRYYVMELLDDWTDVFASLGQRTTGTAERGFIIAGPGWSGSAPEGLPVIVAPTATVWLIGRIQTNGPKDYPAVNGLQEGFKLAPLGYFEKYGMLGVSGVTAKKPVIKKPATKAQVEAMDAEAFFGAMTAAMTANPPPVPDAGMVEKLAALGLFGDAFDYQKLPPAARQALEAAVKSGPGAIRAGAMSYYKDDQTNGWSTPLEGVGVYGTDYMRRAVAAMFLLGANVPEDAVYGFCGLDDSGRPLNGAGRYHIHFRAGQLPPVNAFWSVTLYGPDGFLAENPSGRYAVAPHLGQLSYNADGSLDIFIRHEPPRKNRASNWLPAPKGAFNLTLRMYWPGQAVQSGAWRPAPVQRG